MTETLFGDNITLLNCDCMEYMRSLPDKAFKLAIVDPPYGDASTANFPNPPRQMSRDGGGWFNRYKRNAPSPHGEIRPIPSHRDSDFTEATDGTSILPPPQLSDNQPKGIWWDIAPSQEYFDELFRVSENQIIWGGNYFNLPPTRCFLIWRKISISEKFSMAMCEYAWTSFNANAKWFECAPQGSAKDPRFHPTQKPIRLYEWLLLNYAKEGDTILDTHLGSGSSAIAAHDLGFKFVGMEIDQEYYDKACARLQRHIQTNQPRLFI